MRKKIIGIFVCMLMMTSVTAIGGCQVEYKENQPSKFLQKGDINLSQKLSKYNRISLQSVDTDIIDMIQQLNKTMYLGYLENLTAFGPRVTGTSECEAAGTYIYNEFQTMGLDVRYQNWSYEGYSDRNIEATLPGIDENKDEIYIISAHYDTVVNCPGADDDGSGVAAVLSIAHLMSQYEFNHTVRFVTFSGEEQFMLGSHEYVEEVKGDNIIGVLNVDMIGYGVTEFDFHTFGASENLASQWLTDFMIITTQKYNEYLAFSILRGGAWESDQTPFWEAGYDALFLTALAWNPNYHTSNDTIDRVNIDFAVRNSKLLLASLAELADSNRGSLPKKPSISGPESGGMDEELSFSTSTIDPYNKQIYYMWDFGDETQSNWVGSYDSGILISEIHSWNKEGIYSVKVKAKNTDELESDWSNSILVGIPNKYEKIDQKQVIHGINGQGVTFGGQLAQSFTPTENTLTKVSVRLFKIGHPQGVTISIRSDLNGSDLTSAYLSGSDIVNQLKANWYDFNFPELEIIPGETYYIVWTPDHQYTWWNEIYWMIGKHNPYSNGGAWGNFQGFWEKLEIRNHNEPDFCFKTYYATTKSKNIASDPNVNFLEQNQNIFSIPKQRLGY